MVTAMVVSMKSHLFEVGRLLCTRLYALCLHIRAASIRANASSRNVAQSGELMAATWYLRRVARLWFSVRVQLLPKNAAPGHGRPHPFRNTKLGIAVLGCDKLAAHVNGSESG